MERSKGRTLIGCKWIFIVKCKDDGTYRIDYQETFALIANMKTVRILLSLAANLGWSLHPIDVKNAFLNGNSKRRCTCNYHQVLRGIMEEKKQADLGDFYMA